MTRRNHKIGPSQNLMDCQYSSSSNQSKIKLILRARKKSHVWAWFCPRYAKQILRINLRIILGAYCSNLIFQIWIGANKIEEYYTLHTITMIYYSYTPYLQDTDKILNSKLVIKDRYKFVTKYFAPIVS